MYYLIALVILVLVVFLIAKKSKRKGTAEPEAENRQVASDCCGAHEICEFDESVYRQENIIYFNDEELDELRNVREDQFTGKQIDDLREVLYTLRPEEISKWLISIGKRHIHLPVVLQQEARQLMVEK
jgi:hypothetical protein